MSPLPKLYASVVDLLIPCIAWAVAATLLRPKEAPRANLDIGRLKSFKKFINNIRKKNQKLFYPEKSMLTTKILI